MIKKCLLMFVFLSLIIGGAFAQSKSLFSIGAGGYFTNDFGGGFEDSSPSFKMKTPYIGGGVLAFFDATYVELSLGMLAVNGTFDNGLASSHRDIYGIDFNLFAKIPFQIGDRFSLFPLLGVDYRLVLSAQDDNGAQHQNKNLKDAPTDLSAFWFKAGAGLDVSLNDTLFLRGKVLYGLRLANTYETDAVDILKPGADPLFGHGITVEFALGYRL